MAANGFPALDLPLVFLRGTPSLIIAAIPLEPAARIGSHNPSLLPPYTQRLAALHAKTIEHGIGAAAYAHFGKPIVRKFRTAVVAILSLEHSESEHFLWCKSGLETGRKIFPRGRGNCIGITGLHPVMNVNNGANFIRHASIMAALPAPRKKAGFAHYLRFQF